MITIIRINKDEAIRIREDYPQAHIRRTCQQKSKRHTYYVEEARGVINLLKTMRGQKNGQ